MGPPVLLIGRPLSVWATIQAAIDKGVFSTVKSGKNPGSPNLTAILTAAQQLASAMTYLHERHNITHGDLTGGNVLLTTSPSSPSGLACKARELCSALDCNVACS